MKLLEALFPVIIIVLLIFKQSVILISQTVVIRKVTEPPTPT